MESVGSYIKRERQLRGFSLEEISRATKISLRYLSALEADNYNSLPAEAFVKGFLRSYAQCIGLDPHEVMLVYEQSRGEAEPPGKDISDKTEKKVKKNLLPSKRIVLVGVLAAVGIVAVVYISLYWLEPQRESRSGTGITMVPSTSSDAETVGINGKGEQVKRVETADTSKEAVDKGITQRLTILPMRRAPQAGWTKATALTIMGGEESSARYLSREDGLVLRIHAISGTWVEVKIDALEFDEQLFLTRGDTREWTANDRILLTLGNSRGVKLELNGEEITIPDTEGNVLRNFPLTRNSLAGNDSRPPDGS